MYCDDMGAWKWKESYRKWCTIDEIGDVEMLEQKPDCSCVCYQIWKRYYEHKSSGDVKKLIVLLEGGSTGFAIDIFRWNSQYYSYN